MKNTVVFIVIIVMIFSCNFNIKSSNELVVLEEIKLNIKEPSGITYYKNHLYIASDYNGLVYKTNLKGEIVKKIPTDFTDIEGVAMDKNGNLFVVNENKRTFVKLKLNGETDKKYKIKGRQKQHNSGLEGVCYSKKLDCFFIVNESLPREVMKISRKGKEKESFKIDFANDLSGICFDEKTKNIWIVSDESQKIYEVSTKGVKLKDYKIPVNKAEGITINKDKIYVVSDAENKLYVLKKP
ncbi:SdiA-regulated domain-containing protein [Lutibacter flavus]|uniref:Uncharacterized protein YjiK n=1 Tax=Lutibacter flavus TaxID=691689 RepID=A0A238YPT8_9FLAO|nr:SdiA-regulated domain-containing protein [Lutibacter flavus]SNR73012.1 Uncharacterized protein YjiK [Lutibacter flavus]